MHLREVKLSGSSANKTNASRSGAIVVWRNDVTVSFAGTSERGFRMKRISLLSAEIYLQPHIIVGVPLLATLLHGAYAS